MTAPHPHDLWPEMRDARKAVADALAFMMDEARREAGGAQDFIDRLRNRGWLLVPVPSAPADPYPQPEDLHG